MVRDHLKTLVIQAIQTAQAAGDLPPFDIPSFSLDHPRQIDMGDYAVSVAMQLARIAKLAPPQIAQRIAKHLQLGEMATAEVVNAFVNIRLSPLFLSQQVGNILARGENWGNIDLGQGQKAQVEHGSANPTGFATIGTARNVTVGDTLANTLEAAGYTVHREWYVNDAGTQIRVLGGSVFARYAQACGIDEPMPEKGYLGDDVALIGKQIFEREGERYLQTPREEAVRAIGRLGIDLIMEHIKVTLVRMGIRYDNFFSEKSLHTSGQAAEMLKELSQKGLILEHEGASWFSEEGSPIRSGQGRKQTAEQYAAAGLTQSDDEDAPDIDDKGKTLPVQAVVMRSAKVVPNPDERATYFASDIPYVWNKAVIRGFNPAVYVWGEDHQADVPRVYAAAKALGIPDGVVRIIVYRFITLMRGGEEVRMGKRKGNAIWIDDVIDEMGADALRYVMLSRAIDTKFAFDLNVLKEHNDTNPVFYVQYGHARTCSIERKAEEEGWPMDRTAALVYEHPSELMLIRKIMLLPEMVELIAQSLQPHHYTTYARELAQAFSKFYEDCRIKDSPPDIVYRRLQLVHAVRLTLAKVLRLMGMSTPQKM